MAEYTNYDILQSQDPNQIRQDMFMNLVRSRRFLLEAENGYNGNGHSGWSTADFNRAFRHLGGFTDNFLRMIVEAYVSRLVIQGFNVGQETTDEIESPGDELAWKIWRSNHLDQAVSLAHRDAMKFGNAYVLVDPFTTVNGVPRVTVETPFQVAVYQDPSDRYVNAAALKSWQAADGFFYCNLYTAGHCLKYQSDKSYADWTEQGLFVQTPRAEEITWNQYDEIAHDLGQCPVITIENQPTLTRGGTSDLELLLPMQRAIDNLARNLIIASEYAAFPQKFALNIEQPKDGDGNPLPHDAVEASLSRFWGFAPGDPENHPVQVGSFPAADLSNYVNGMEELIQNMAMIAAIPHYRLMGRLANLSASAILAAEAGFIDQCRTKQNDYGVGWSSAMTLAMNAAGKPTTVDEVQVLWKDPSAVSGASMAAQLVSMQSIGVPQPALWRYMGATPQEIDRWTAYNEANPPAGEETAQPTLMVSDAVRELTAHNAPNGQTSDAGMDPVGSNSATPEQPN